MYKAVTLFGLAGLAAAGGPPAYGTTSSEPAGYSSAPAAYSSSNAAPVSSSAPAVYGSSSTPAAVSSSAPAVYGSSSSVPAAISSSAPAVYSGSSSVVYSASASSSSPPLPTSTCDCWSTCFESAGVTSEADLCGNTAVNQCIYYTCSPSEDQAYWAWYESYCPAPSSSPSSSGPAPYSSATLSTVVVSASASYSAPSASATGDCWGACFAANGVTSEADLCGNDAVSACIFNTCSSDLDRAYWEWYDSYCYASTGTSTCTEVVTPTAPATWTETTPYNTEPYTTTYETTTYAVVTSAATTGLPSAPATWTPGPTPVPAPYTAPVWSSPYSYPPSVTTAATGTGSWGATASPTGYSPVPATGAGAVNKPAGLIAAVIAAAVLL